MTKSQRQEAKEGQQLIADLEKYRTLAGDDPQFNPVERLATDMFLKLEAGTLSASELRAAAQALNNDAFEDRAREFHHRRAGGADLAAVINELAGKGFDSFRAVVERAAAGVVFTAHPTFSLSLAKGALVARYPGDNSKDLEKWRNEARALASEPRDAISLRYEHEEASAAITNAQSALRALNSEFLVAARKAFPKEWASLRPNPVSIATWVGYDLDGRSDIHWGETIRIRIAEKASQLRRYEAELSRIAKLTADKDLLALRDEFAQSAALAEHQAEAFAGDLNNPDIVVPAANLLTSDAEGRLTSLKAAISLIGRKIDAEKTDEMKMELMLLRAEMESCGLGLARIHLRVNAAQVRSALRADLGLDPDTGFSGRSALDVAAKKSTAAQQRAVNFGFVFLEKMTARRQFMLCAQILKHIDADTPIRFLIAECESPATVMGAVYLARLYGVEKKLDISPLFETPQALESGGRFIERLLHEPEYRDYVTERGRISIQLGFSDSGRFMGQCAAGMATERLQVLFARALVNAKMTHIEALVFNTHGESMGRGAHPQNFIARMNHLSTPWVRSRFAKEGIALAEECSFQGGEGYLHFQTKEIAQTTLSLVWNAVINQDRADSSDEFYSDINYSWDFYRGLKTWQEGLFQRDDYRWILSGFAQRFLYKTGSRQAKRAKAGGFDLSALRAIPHNAILQQIAAPANVSGGFGAAAGREMDRLVEHIKASARMRDLTALAKHARNLTDLSVLRAYAALFAPAYWSSLATSASDGRKAELYESVQISLGHGETSIAFHRLTDFLAQDIRRFDAILRGENEAADSIPKNRLKVLHAIRQALMARAVTLVAGAPAFSRRHDVAHRDLIKMALDWRLIEAAEMLREIFPAKANENAVFSGLAEQVQDHSFEGGAYPEIHRTIIEPIEEIAEISHVISKGIAHHYGAFG
ncbi:phosphoenolpyruvate carboxylase [Hyphococcus sp.]|uniref:phosphoenolpyruvate carboxylase n=1 Tax=Hyphococcus sp. TaxID=2038636 RepID=UPI00208A4311|nr:MAG: hypothetical protein DHS20C04_20690 [Marinicaulis sp.]